MVSIKSQFDLKDGAFKVFSNILYTYTQSVPNFYKVLKVHGPVLEPNSIAYNDLEVYMQDMTFDFTNNTVTGVEIYDDYALVSTNEEFDLINATGEYMNYNRDKLYTVVINSSGHDIEIYDLKVPE